MAAPTDVFGTARVVEVPEGVARADEALGTKPKFWFPGPDGRSWLFKRALRSGEDWSEWLAAQVARALGVPAAEVALAAHQGCRGTVSPSFLAPGEQLFHGNELLLGLDPDYPTQGVRKVSAHTVSACLDALAAARAAGAGGEGDARDDLLGHLLLDALVGNTDRHHENWAVVRGPSGTRLAPSYDHAASLGWNLPEAKARHRLEGRDGRATVDAYCRRARSALYLRPGAPRPLHPADAFEVAAGLRPAAGARWRARAERLDLDELAEAAARLPATHISEPHRAFAVTMVACNRARILGASPAGFAP
jgi:hypothetical protein